MLAIHEKFFQQPIGIMINIEKFYTKNWQKIGITLHKNYIYNMSLCNDLQFFSRKSQEILSLLKTLYLEVRIMSNPITDVQKIFVGPLYY